MICFEKNYKNIFESKKIVWCGEIRIYCHHLTKSNDYLKLYIRNLVLFIGHY